MDRRRQALDEIVYAPTVRRRREPGPSLAMLSAVSNNAFSYNQLISALAGAPTARRSPVSSCECTDPAGETRSARAVGKTELTPEERSEVERLARRDAEVRRHERAHKAAAGQAAAGAPSFTYQTGPDGKGYAVGGEVGIDTSPVQGDPQATIRKMKQIQRAANAPAEPSAQDRRVAAQAAATERKARAELAEQRDAGPDETGFGGSVARADHPAQSAGRLADPYQLALLLQQPHAAGRFINAVV